METQKKEASRMDRTQAGERALGQHTLLARIIKTQRQKLGLNPNPRKAKQANH